jgi:hypothetical protein
VFNFVCGDYRRTLELDVNSMKGVGNLVAPQAPSYNLKLKADMDLDFLVLKSCNREVIAEKNGSSFVYNYSPLPGIEDNRACPVMITGVEKSTAKKVWGYLDFQDQRNLLPATVKCNGEMKRYGGVSVCQAKAGLIQRIEFDGEALGEALTDIHPDCALTQINPKTFEFKMARGLCYFKFVEKAAPNRFHRLSSFGWDEILLEQKL